MRFLLNKREPHLNYNLLKDPNKNPWIMDCRSYNPQPCKGRQRDAN